MVILSDCETNQHLATLLYAIEQNFLELLGNFSVQKKHQYFVFKRLKSIFK